MNNTYNSVFLKYNALYPYEYLIYVKYVILYVIYVYSLDHLYATNFKALYANIRNWTYEYMHIYMS